jgi:hypothetical protein
MSPSGVASKPGMASGALETQPITSPLASRAKVWSAALAAGLSSEQATVLRQQAAALRDALQQVGDATQAAWASGNPTQALANAVPYLQAFGHTVLAWVWLDVALAVLRKDAAVLVAISQGKLRATAYFYHYELPKIGAWLQVVKSADLTCAQMGEEEF